MARDPNPTNRPADTAVWFARIRSGAARSEAPPSASGINPLLQQRLRDAADAAAEAADRAARAARAADRAVGLAELIEDFGPAAGAGRDELAAAANESIEASAEARDVGARAEEQGQLARLAAQEEGAAAEPEMHRHAGLGESWHR